MSPTFVAQAALSPAPFFRQAWIRLTLWMLLAALLLAAPLSTSTTTDLSGSDYRTDDRTAQVVRPAGGLYDGFGDGGRGGDSGLPVPLEKQALFEQVKVAEAVDELCKLLGFGIFVESAGLHAIDAGPGLKLFSADLEYKDGTLPSQLLQRPPPFTG